MQEPQDHVTCPLWLVPGARVLVWSARGGPRVETVCAVDFPWLVHLEGHRGGTHSRNVLRPATEDEIR